VLKRPHFQSESHPLPFFLNRPETLAVVDKNSDSLVLYGIQQFFIG
jgi:hypothetical protein